MKQMLTLLLILLALVFCGCAEPQDVEPTPHVVTIGEALRAEILEHECKFIVGYHGEAEASDAAALTAAGGVVDYRYQIIPAISAACTDETAEALFDSIAVNPRIRFVEPDIELTTDATPNDPLFVDQWGVHNTGQLGGLVDADVDGPEAWDISIGDQSMVIAVIDSGVQVTHPDLVDNIWVNPAEIAGNGIDDDGNGYIDDIHGWNFHANNDVLDVGIEESKHGTHVSGTIAATGDNGVGVAGVNWRAQIMVLKFINTTNGSLSDAIEAIEYAADHNVRLISASWGSHNFSQSLRDAIEASGILFVAAAGNDGQDNEVAPHYPSDYDLSNVVSVAAVDRNDELASFSNYGVESVDLAAPGVAILSTWPGSAYEEANGTSMATPHVSGVAGLVMSSDPNLTAEEVKDILLISVVPIPSLDGVVATGGRLNAARAIARAGTVLRVDRSDDDALAVDCSAAVANDCSLRGALLTAAADPDVSLIRLPDGVFTLGIAGQGDDLGQTGDLDIHADLAIQGAGVGLTVVDGAGLDRIFDVHAGAVDLFDLTLTGGLTAGAGGAARIDGGAQLEMRNVRIENSQAGGSGGGLACENGTATVTDVTFDGNTASANGGGLWVGADCAVDLVRVGGTANSGVEGGAIANEGGLTAVDLSLADNDAQQGGGLANAGVTDIVRAVLEANDASLRGGGLHNTGELTVSGAQISANLADTGAGFHNLGTAELVNVTLSGNVAASAGGGGHSEGDVSSPSVGATLTNCTVAGNLAGGTPSALSAGGAGLDDAFVLANNVLDGACTGSAGLFASLGGNLESPGDSCGLTDGADAPALPSLGIEPLADNLGPNLTHALAPGSPAIAAAVSALCPSIDQRGVIRLVCDSGAYESPDPLQVDRLDDPLVASGCTPAPDDCTLRGAVAIANLSPVPDVIELPTGTIALDGGPIELIDHLAIAGADREDSIVDGQHAGGIFEVDTNDLDVAFADLTITGGASPGGGAIMLSPDSTGVALDLSRVNLVDNAGQSGGALFIGEGHSATIDQCRIADNTAVLGGGIMNSGVVTVTNSEISGNEAVELFVAIFIFRGFGGGLVNAGTASLTNVSFTNNYGRGGGGGIWHDGGQFETTTPRLLDMTNVSFVLNLPAELETEEESLAPGSITFTNTLFAGNCAGDLAAFDSQGGNVDDGEPTCGLTEPSDLPWAVLSIAQAADYGGGTNTVGLMPGSVPIDAGLAAACPATDQRGVARDDGLCDIGAFEGAVTLFEVDRTDDDPNASDCTTAPNDCSLRGAVIASNLRPGGEVIQLGQETYQLSVAGEGEDDALTGDLDVIGDLQINGAAPHVTIVDADGLDRVFDVHGGRFAALLVTLSGGATAANGGGLRMADGAKLILASSWVEDNSAASGGGLACNESDVLAYGPYIQNNVASANGGGVSAEDCRLRLEGTNLLGNSATTGAGIYANGLGHTVILDSAIQQNVASAAGGGLYTTVSSLLTLRTEVRGTDINTNEATNGPGGGIWIANSDLSLTGGEIRGNLALGDGGGAYLSQAPGIHQLDDVEVNQNSADRGAGLYTDSVRGTGFLNVSGAVLLSDITLINNTASGDGGGLFVANDSNAIIEVAVLRSNQAAAGGGAFFGSGSTIDLTMAEVAWNDANGSATSGGLGGGLYAAGDVSLENVTVSGNQGNGTVGDNAGGIWYDNSHPDAELQLDLVTFAQNAPNAMMALDMGGNPIRVGQTLIAGVCDGDASAFDSRGGNLESPGSTCNLIAASDVVSISEPGLDALGDFGGFSQTHRLFAGSPAVDALGNCYGQDQRGEERDDGACDIGAFERQGSDPCVDDSECSDGTFCNGAEICNAGVCQAGAAPACDDGVSCTVDVCDENADACVATPDDGVCDNAAFCDGVEYCDVTLDCQAGAPVVCDDGVGCTLDVCDETTDACGAHPDDSVCDNGSFCDGAEVCDVMLDCQAGAPVVCDDGVGCTVDVCDEVAGACVAAPDDSVCDNGVVCDGVELCDAAAGCSDGPLASQGTSCDDSDHCSANDVCDGAGSCGGFEFCSPGSLYFSTTSRVTLSDGTRFEDEDIIAFDLTSGEMSLYFDGSDVGLMSEDIDAFAVESDGSIVMSLNSSANIAVVGGPDGAKVDDSDLVRFVPTALGDDTAGQFIFVFDGSDVGLTTASEDIDALSIAADGGFVVSFAGNASTSDGQTFRDEDLAVFHANTLGSNTSGEFSMIADGSALQLGGSGEDIGAAHELVTGIYFLSGAGALRYDDLVLPNEDIGVLNTTTGTWSPSAVFDGSSNGVGGNIDAVWFTF